MPNPFDSLHFVGYDHPEKIGQGGMSSVWKMRQISLDRWVAVKILAPEQSSTDLDIDRFQSEARMVAQMNHPGIVQIYDAFYQNDQFCYVMEYVNGESIATWIANRGCLSEEFCLSVAARVAQALAYAWERQRLVHCDIKPDNILVDIDNTVKVSDFGLSKSLFSLQARQSPEGDDAVVFGTPSYMSPEQAMGEENLTIQSDMYALGATLYHMSTGRRLFHERSLPEVMEAQVREQDADAFSYNPGLSTQFCDFLAYLLNKDPTQRYPNWPSVLAEIEAIRQHQPLAWPETHASPTRSTLQRDAVRPRAPISRKARARAFIQRFLYVPLKALQEQFKLLWQLPSIRFASLAILSLILLVLFLLLLLA